MRHFLVADFNFSQEESALASFSHSSSKNNNWVLLRSHDRDFSYHIIVYSCEAAEQAIHHDQHISIICLGQLGSSEILSKILSFYNTNQIFKVKELKGLFLTLIIDKLKKKFWVLNDRLGMMPLYYYSKNDQVILATQMKFFLWYDRLVWPLNHGVIFEMLLRGFIKPPDTLITAIFSLSISQYLLFHRELRVAELPLSSPAIEQDDFSLDKMYEQLQNIFQVYCGSHLKTAVMLSGGLDSSLIIALLAKLTGEKVTGFTLAGEADCPDLLRVKTLKRSYNISSHCYQPNPINLDDYITQSVWLGESEIVGRLSLNAWLEYAFTTAIGKEFSQVLTGDCTLSLPTARQLAPINFFNFGILSQDLIWKVLAHSRMKSQLPSLQKILHHQIARETIDYPTFSSETYASLIWKINGKIRTTSTQTYLFPFTDTDFFNYLRLSRKPPALVNYSYRTLLKKMCLNFKLLPEEIILAKKRWMPSPFESKEWQIPVKAMTATVLNNSSIIQEFFSKSKLEEMMTSLTPEKSHSLLMTLVTLNKFSEIFIQHPTVTRQKFKNDIVSLIA